MGIINHDPYETRFTIEPISNSYISIGGNQLSFNRTETGFTVTGTFFVYHTYEASRIGKEPLGVIYIEATISDEELKQADAYTIIYNALKKKFPNHTDK